MTTPPPAATCTRCGAAVSPGARFCAICGADVSGEQSQAPTAHVAAHKATMTATSLLQAVRHATAGDYEVQAEIGRGGMATVFLAHEIALDRKVAIKVMSPALTAGEGMVERFKREARTAASLSHPHIIPIFAVRESDQLCFFVMKFVEGRPLDSIIKEVGPLPIPMVRAILQQVGAALGYAHRRRIVHRDVKPANVMIDADGWAIVTDFGIAKATEKQALTMTGATIGTPSYMSPEQCAAKDVTGASDQYSLGIVAYEMVTGRLPFVADSIMAIMYAHFNEPPPPVSQYRPDCPPEIVAALEKMLAKDPADRFPDVETAVSALGAVPLAHDDPVRTQMMTLAATGAAAQTLRGFATPVSPAPPARSKAAPSKTVPPTTGMTLSPARVTVAVGGAVQLTASRKSRAGVTLPGNEITWASTDTAVATVSDSGLVTAVGPGNVVITATMGMVSATGQVTVTPVEARRRRTGVVVGTVLALGAAGVAAWQLGPWNDAATPPVEQRPAVETQAVVPPPAPAPADTAPASPPPQPTAIAARPSPTPRRDDAAARERHRQDSILSSLRAESQTARGRALGAGATAAELAGGDALRDSAERLARSNRYPESFSRFAEAQTQWRAAEQTARVRADRAAAAAATAAAPPPRPETQPSAAPPPAAPSAAATRQQIVDAVLAYGKALESRNIAQIRQAYPGLTTQQERGWRDFFQVAQNLQVSLGVTDLQQSVDAAEATVTGALEYRNAQNRRDERQPVTFRATLERGGAGWRITSIR